MKRKKNNRERIYKREEDETNLELNFSSFLEIKSVNHASHSKLAYNFKQNEVALKAHLDSPSHMLAKGNKLFSYMKSLEEENRKLQLEIFVAKEKNSVALRENKDLQMENASQQNYITRLSVEISKLNRNLYQAATDSVEVKCRNRLRLQSKKVVKSRHLLSGINNSCIVRRNLNDSILLNGSSEGIKAISAMQNR